MRDHAHADVVMSGKRSRLKAPAVKKAGGTYEFMVAAFLLLAGSIGVGFLWMRNAPLPPSVSKAQTNAATTEAAPVYSERDRVYLQKVLKEALGPGAGIKVR